MTENQYRECSSMQLAKLLATRKENEGKRLQDNEQLDEAVQTKLGRLEMEFERTKMEVKIHNKIMNVQRELVDELERLDKEMQKLEQAKVNKRTECERKLIELQKVSIGRFLRGRLISFLGAREYENRRPQSRYCRLMTSESYFLSYNCNKADRFSLYWSMKNLQI